MDHQDWNEMGLSKNGPVGVREGADGDSIQEQDIHQTSASHNTDVPAPHLDVGPYLLTDESVQCRADAEIEIHQLSTNDSLQCQSPMLVGGSCGLFPSWTSEWWTGKLDACHLARSPIANRRRHRSSGVRYSAGWEISQWQPRSLKWRLSIPPSAHSIAGLACMHLLESCRLLSGLCSKAG